MGNLHTDLAGVLEVRRQELAQADSISGGYFENTFFIDTSGVGEVTQAVNFSVRFVEEPHVTCGWRMLPNQRLAAGTFPLGNAGVYVYKIDRRPDSGLLYYDGATIALNVFNGADDLALRFSLVFRGRALRNPAGV